MTDKRFSELAIGDWFRHGNDVFMKCHQHTFRDHVTEPTVSVRHAIRLGGRPMPINSAREKENK
jgi:hypothetical protein